MLEHVAIRQQGILLAEGKRTYILDLPDGSRLQGQAFLTRSDWPWRDYLHLPGIPYARLRATSPT